MSIRRETSIEGDLWLRCVEDGRLRLLLLSFMRCPFYRDVFILADIGGQVEASFELLVRVSTEAHSMSCSEQLSDDAEVSLLEVLKARELLVEVLRQVKNLLADVEDEVLAHAAHHN